MLTTLNRYGKKNAAKVSMVLKLAANVGHTVHMNNAQKSFYSRSLKVNYSVNDVCNFWSNVEMGSNDECWMWKRRKCKDGYGRTKISRKDLRANRVAMVFSGSEIPEGLLSCHRCDNPGCCNPGHLFAASNDENMADMVRKKRSASGYRNACSANPLLVAGVNNGRAVLSDEDVIEIRKNPPKGKKIRDLAEKFGLTKEAIRHAFNGRNWKHLPMPSEDAVILMRTHLNSNHRVTTDSISEIRAMIYSGVPIAKIRRIFGMSSHAANALCNRIKASDKLKN